MRKPRGSHDRTVIFLGDSVALIDVLTWAEENGFAPIEIPNADLVCAVVDRDVLDGRRTPSEDAVLKRVHAFGVPCLTPDQALIWLSGADDRHRLTSI